MKLCDCIFSEMRFFLPRRDAVRDRARAWGCYMAFPVVKQREFSVHENRDCLEFWSKNSFQFRCVNTAAECTH